MMIMVRNLRLCYLSRHHRPCKRTLKMSGWAFFPSKRAPSKVCCEPSVNSHLRSSYVLGSIETASCEFLHILTHQSDKGLIRQRGLLLAFCHLPYQLPSVLGTCPIDACDYEFLTGCGESHGYLKQLIFDR